MSKHSTSFKYNYGIIRFYTLTSSEHFFATFVSIEMYGHALRYQLVGSFIVPSEATQNFLNRNGHLIVIFSKVVMYFAKVFISISENKYRGKHNQCHRKRYEVL